MRREEEKEKKKEKTKTDDILEILAKNLTNHLKVIMEASGETISDDEAENMMSNISMHVLNKRLKKGL